VQLQELKNRLNAVPTDALLPSWWAEFLEAPGLSAEAIALCITLGGPHWRALLRWLTQWRHVSSPISARQVMDEEGLSPGPELGMHLKRLRYQALDCLYSSNS